VGAALLCADGAIVSGANVENRSYGLTLCAERAAVAGAVSGGRRSFLAVAVYTPDSVQAVAPCGACRQVLSEFAGPQTPILMSGSGESRESTLGELYPLDSLHELKDRP
jgi:cytidine deaminase